MVDQAEAEAYARELFSQLPDAEEEAILIHSLAVLKQTQALLATATKEEQEQVASAAWLHDIGRARQAEGHAHISLELATEKFGTLHPTIQDCILNHGSKMRPTTNIGKAFQLADKLAFFTPESVDAHHDKKEFRKKLMKTMEKIKRIVERSAEAAQ